MSFRTTLTRSRFLFDGGVVYIVADDNQQEFVNEQEFPIHRNLIRSKSDFFYDHFDDNNHTVVFRVQDSSPAVCKRLQYWMYCGKIFHNDEACTEEDVAVLIKLWLPADRLKLPALQNDTMYVLHALMEKCEARNAAECFDLCEVFHEIGRDCELRWFVVDWFIWSIEPLASKAASAAVVEDHEVLKALYKASRHKANVDEDVNCECSSDPTLDVRNYLVGGWLCIS